MDVEPSADAGTSTDDFPGCVPDVGVVHGTFQIAKQNAEKDLSLQ